MEMRVESLPNFFRAERNAAIQAVLRSGRMKNPSRCPDLKHIPVTCQGLLLALIPSSNFSPQRKKWRDNRHNNNVIGLSDGYFCR